MNEFINSKTFRIIYLTFNGTDDDFFFYCFLLFSVFLHIPELAWLSIFGCLHQRTPHSSPPQPTPVHSEGNRHKRSPKP